MAESAKDNPATAKPLTPAKETQRLMEPISRKNFKNLLQRAINPPAVKPQPKST